MLKKILVYNNQFPRFRSSKNIILARSYACVPIFRTTGIQEAYFSQLKLESSVGETVNTKVYYSNENKYLSIWPS